MSTTMSPAGVSFPTREDTILGTALVRDYYRAHGKVLQVNTQYPFYFKHFPAITISNEAFPVITVAGTSFPGVPEIFAAAEPVLGLLPITDPRPSIELSIDAWTSRPGYGMFNGNPFVVVSPSWPVGGRRVPRLIWRTLLSTLRTRYEVAQATLSDSRLNDYDLMLRTSTASDSDIAWLTLCSTAVVCSTNEMRLIAEAMQRPWVFIGAGRYLPGTVKHHTILPPSPCAGCRGACTKLRVDQSNTDAEGSSCYPPFLALPGDIAKEVLDFVDGSIE